MNFLFLILALFTFRSEATELAAAYEHQSVPFVMTVNEEALAMVAMRNVGPVTWSGAEGVRLATQNPSDNFNWGLNRLPLGKSENLGPGEGKDFVFTITAPGRPGIYSFQWKMVQGSSGWFGDATPNTPIVVLGPNWLKRIYVDLLGRDPSDKEKQAAMKLITGGTAFPTLVMGLINSSDHSKLQINESYKRLLGRDARLIETRAWKEEVLANGQKAVLAQVAASDEYYKLQGSTTPGFVAALFRDLLYSPPDATLEAWANQIDNESKPRPKIVEEFLNSEWFCQNIVLGWYRKYLRQTKPDLEAMAPWIAELKKGNRWEDTLAELLASDEYQIGSRAKVKEPTRALATEDSFW